MAGKCLRSIGRVSRSGWKVFEEYRGCVEEWLESVRGLSEGDRGVVFRMNEEERRCLDSHGNSLEIIEEERETSLKWKRNHGGKRRSMKHKLSRVFRRAKVSQKCERMEGERRKGKGGLVRRGESGRKKEKEEGSERRAENRGRRKRGNRGRRGWENTRVERGKAREGGGQRAEGKKDGGKGRG